MDGRGHLKSSSPSVSDQVLLLFPRTIDKVFLESKSTAVKRGPYSLGTTVAGLCFAVGTAIST